jgi:tetratricopeptide (TPR) repeat protein
MAPTDERAVTERARLPGSLTIALIAAALLTLLRPAQSAMPSDSQGSVTIEQRLECSNNTNIGVNNGQVTINQQDPAALAAMARVFADQMSATTEARAKAEARVADLAAKLGFTTAAVREFFRILGQQNVSEDMINEQFARIAAHFAQAQSELAALDPDDPRAAELAGQAKQALDGGRLTEADNLLDQAKEIELAAYRQAQELRKKAQEADDRLSLGAAKLLSNRGNVALIRLDYLSAAARFRQASDLVPGTHPTERGDYLYSQADALYRQGDEYGDNAALLDAIAAFRSAQREWTRDRVPLDWAKAQTYLGSALTRLGERESGTARLHEAISALRVALEVRTRELVPLDWARTQARVADALELLGERDEGTAHLLEAVAGYRVGLEELRRERVPVEWAWTQTQLGNALERLGEREIETEHLRQAVAAYQAALQETPRERQPLYWAATQNALGVALERLGERESGTAHLEEAVTVLRVALLERTRERLPLKWAWTQANLGNALEKLGERESGTVHLEEAVAAYRAAVGEMTRERAPLDWATMQSDLGAALQNLASGRAARCISRKRLPPIARRWRR